MLLKFLGIIFVAIAFIGVFLPLLPTTPFLLVATACFAKSSPRLHSMLLNNKTFGPLIYHWQQSRSIPKRGKVIALCAMVATAFWSCYILPVLWLKVFVVILLICPFVFLLRLPIVDNNMKVIDREVNKD